MQSGKPTTPSKTALLPAVIRIAGAFALAAVSACTVSCTRQGSFEALLARYDLTVPGAERSGIVQRAASLAESGTDWLRLLKRVRKAQETDAVSYNALAARAIKAFPHHEPVARAAARAFLDAGLPQRALALFPDPLPVEAHRSLYAEVLIALCAAQPGPALFLGSRSVRINLPEVFQVNETALGIISAEAGDPRPLFDAALLRMAAGDKEGATLFALSAYAHKTQERLPDAETAWDLELPDIVRAHEIAQSPRALCLYADASMVLGFRAEAVAVYRRVVREFPQYSWAPYAALAEAETDSERGDAWVTAMVSRFGTSPGAHAFAAARMARRGEAAGALAHLEGQGMRALESDAEAGAVHLAVLFMLGRQTRLANESLRYAQRFRDDGKAQDRAASHLARLGRYADAAELSRVATVRGVSLKHAFFFSALGRLLAGDVHGAAAVLEKDGAASGDFSAAFNIGLVYRFLGEHALAADRLRVAVSLLRTRIGSDTATDTLYARALAELGEALRASGRSAEADSAFRAAQDADPLGAGSFQSGGDK